MTNNVVLIADMGATYSRIALLDDQYQFVGEPTVLLSKDFSSPASVIRHFLKQHQLSTPSQIFIAIAAAITSDYVNCANISWQFSIKETETQLKAPVNFINDFEALSLSLALLTKHDLIQLGKTAYDENSLLPKALIGTGSGFGTALTIQHKGRYLSIPAEGGHSLYAPQDQEEVELIRLASCDKMPLIIEDFLSGEQGISRLIKTMHLLHDKPLHFSTPKELVDIAKTKDPFACQILNRYCKMLGAVAANISLITGAQGGVYIGGGFVPRFIDFIQHSSFRDSFESIPTVHYYLKEIPTFVIAHPFATLLGLQYKLLSSI